MKMLRLWVVLLGAVSLFDGAAFASSAGSAATPVSIDMLLPVMREWRSSGGSLVLGKTIAIGRNASPAVTGAAQQLAKDLAWSTGRPWAVTSREARPGDIRLMIGERSAQAKTGEYRLSIGRHILVEAPSPTGLYYGGRTLLQLVQTAPDPAAASLPRGAGRDFPETRMRAVMLDLGRHYYHVESIKALIEQMGSRKLNTLHLHFTDWPAFRLNSDRFPGLAPAGASYDRADIREIEAEAARHHVTIIPEIDLPSHAVPLTDYRPELGFACPSMRSAPWLRKAAPHLTDKAWTIDITREENTRWLKGLLDEFIPWFAGPYFHVGGDEYQYDEDKLRCPELIEATRRLGLKYPGDVMIRWINQANAMVKAHGKRTIIWSWWGYKDDKTSITPDKDIVINVWNPEVQTAIMAQGYDVILSPEDTLYITPAEDRDRSDDYGLVDLEKVHERYPFDRSANVLGYALSVWSDGAERHTDGYFLGRAEEPMAVLAERLWSGQGRQTIWDLLSRANKIEARRRWPKSR